MVGALPRMRCRICMLSPAWRWSELHAHNTAAACPPRSTAGRLTNTQSPHTCAEPASPHTPLTPEASLGASLPSSLGSPGAARLDAYRTQRATKFKYSW